MALRALLQPLKNPQSGTWHLVMMPDPRKFEGFHRLSSEPGTRDFVLSLQTNIHAAKDALDNPLYGVSSNFSSAKPKTRLFQRYSGSEHWVRIVVTDQKTPDGSLPRAPLARLLDKFPTYKLKSKEEAVSVIEDIEKILSSDAISVDVLPAK